jgi:hypothetical protein
VMMREKVRLGRLYVYSLNLAAGEGSPARQLKIYQCKNPSAGGQKPPPVTESTGRPGKL